MSECSLPVLLQVCIEYLEKDLPIPVDTYMEMQSAGIDADQIEQMLEDGMTYEEILDQLNP